MRFEGVRIHKLPFKRFKEGAAFALPGIGIFVGKGQENNKQLLMHEFGHILQFRKWGFWLFWKHIAPDSLKSARRANKNLGSHMETWTEWSANRLSYDYFKQPTDWNLKRFPISPFTENLTAKPKFTKTNDDFLKNWVEGG